MNICPVCETLTDAATCKQDGYRTVSAEQYRAERRDLLLGMDFEGRYRIEEKLGEGGMGVVYLATQLNVNRPVAIKLLRTTLSKNLKAIERFQQEARAVAGLQHPHIVALYDFGQTPDGQLYLVTEFIDGRSLTEIIEAEAPLCADRTIDIGYQLADALIEAHGHGVIHRDLKPDNILLRAVGRHADFAKVLDFGIAKVTTPRKSHMTLTNTGVAVGTPQYISPEQATAQPVSHQTDFYALGVILYEMLTGVLPFEADSHTDFMIAHVHTQPELPTLDGVPLSGPLVDVIMQCLEKRKEDRPMSASALADALEAARHPAAGQATHVRTGNRQQVPTKPAAPSTDAGVDAELEIPTTLHPLITDELPRPAAPRTRPPEHLPPPPTRPPRMTPDGITGVGRAPALSQVAPTSAGREQVGVGLAVAMLVIVLAIVAFAVFADHVGPTKDRTPAAETDDGDPEARDESGEDEDED